MKIAGHLDGWDDRGLNQRPNRRSWLVPRKRRFDLPHMQPPEDRGGV